MIRRRSLLAALALPPVIPSTGPGLGQIAAEHGRGYGAAIMSHLLVNDPAFAALAIRECGLVMPDYETKFEIIQPHEGVFNFTPIDNLTSWAQAHDKKVRGHALVWHQQIPDWALKAIAETPRRARAVLEAHLAGVLGHTRPTIRDWDVVNEVIADPPGSDVPQATGELRDCPWLRAMGPGYIPASLTIARQQDATLRLVLNEYGTEECAPHHIEKRRRLLGVVRELRAANIPLDAVGLQGHLQMVQPFSGPSFTAFCRELRAEGVDLVVTEMDVREHWKVPDGIPARDRVVADRVKAFMDAAIDGGVKTFVTWGLTDHYSWLATNYYVKRRDGLEHRGLPFDDDGNRTPYWQAMAAAFRR